MRTIFLILVVFLSMNTFSDANNSSSTSKEDDIAELVRLIDPGEQEVVWLKKLFVDLAKVDKSEHERLLQEINFDTVVALYHPLYEKYFTHDEIKELIRFYEKEHGVKMARTKNDSFRMQSFTQEELDKIEEFKKTKLGKKYTKLNKKISHQHSKLAMKFVDSLR